MSSGSSPPGAAAYEVQTLVALAIFAAALRRVCFNQAQP